ncbi:hypothetical protein TNCV_2225061 [Trichonephila clavipes]|nr:hypothetical protein TNCV_2225061 [Trichonephila clavipes]
MLHNFSDLVSGVQNSRNLEWAELLMIFSSVGNSLESSTHAWRSRVLPRFLGILYNWTLNSSIPNRNDQQSSNMTLNKIFIEKAFTSVRSGTYATEIERLQIAAKFILKDYMLPTGTPLVALYRSFGITFPNGERFNSCQVIYSQFGLAIHQNDHQASRRFVEWAQNEIAVVPDFHKRILFSDEVHFWLNGYVNKQNCCIWSEANPQV